MMMALFQRFHFSPISDFYQLLVLDGPIKVSYAKSHSLIVKKFPLDAPAFAVATSSLLDSNPVVESAFAEGVC